MTTDSRPPFVTFLLPTIRFPFRQCHTSLASSSSTTLTSRSTSPFHSSDLTPNTSPSNSTVNIVPNTPLAPSIAEPSNPTLTQLHPSTLRCLSCSTDFAFTTQILSKNFTGRLGRAYLVSPPQPPPFVPSFPPKPRPKAELVNTRTGRPTSRELLTGMHLVADVSCLICATVVGWKYLDAREDAQRYKIGKIILERERVCIGGCLEDEGRDKTRRSSYLHILKGGGECQKSSMSNQESEIQFDSEDEEECESLFTGTWDREVVARRRKAKFIQRIEAENVTSPTNTELSSRVSIP
ncbi:unnamed protein product [Blumeria hordei]|uniref:Yippee domain-containing protein n=2 Tax=Blumeria hordei TaxID=2867405 RepID=A0A383V3A5_BLUHO|nr:yippee family protein [Blumeria hordei DH14]SZF06275.1 unnamed protein product [Blumeria hordei]